MRFITVVATFAFLIYLLNQLAATIQASNAGAAAGITAFCVLVCILLWSEVIR